MFFLEFTHFLDFVVVVGKFLITDSVSLILSSLFRFSVLSWFSLLVLQLLSCVWPFVTPWIPCPSWSPGVCPNHVYEISDAVLEDCTFVGFCPFFFFLGCQVFWSILFIVIPYVLLSFSGVSCTFSFYISDLIFCCLSFSLWPSLKIYQFLFCLSF